MGELYLEKGHIILDLFGSRDGEGLAWLRNPNVSKNEVLLIHGDNVDVKAPCDDRAISDLTLDDFNDYRARAQKHPKPKNKKPGGGNPPSPLLYPST